MILTKLSIKNVRRYYGEQTIEFLRPIDSQHVHLVGGKNGAGKTTMFESIQACLFASKSDPILRARDFSRTEPGPREMAVEIEFVHESQSFVLSRSWTRRSGPNEHSINSVVLHSLLQNLDSGDSITEEDDIAEFMNSLVPFQTRNLFLFDGEKVQSYIDKASESVRDAIERLLGLNPYIQLQRDVESIQQTMRKERTLHDVNEDLLGKQETVDRNDASLRSIDRRRKDLTHSISETKADYAKLELEEARLQGLFDPKIQAERRAMENQRNALLGDIEEYEAALTSLLPKEAIVSWFWPEILGALESTSPNGRSLPETIEELATFLHLNRDAIYDALASDSVERLSEILAYTLGNISDEGVNNADEDSLESLAALIGAGKDRIASFPEKLQALRSSLDKVSHEIAGLPSADNINIDAKNLHDQMTAVRTAQARHEASLQALAGEKDRLTEESDGLKRDIARLTKEKVKYRSLTDNIEVCEQVLAVLRDFVSDYRSTRVGQLQEIVNRKFRELTNAPGLIESIQIDTDNVELRLLNKKAELLAMEQSAGQKEILAFALIASVVELSNRQVPAVIDTPLARLDMAHRKNALHGFFPCLGPQVVILATDSEIGPEEMERMAPILATKHHLHLDTQTGQTEIRNGYFDE